MAYFFYVPVGYYGSSSWQTSVANAEILPSPPVSWTTPYNFHKLSLFNKADCTLIVNGNDSVPIFVPANMGFGISPDDGDLVIWSLKIIETGIQFTWVGEY